MIAVAVIVGLAIALLVVLKIFSAENRFKRQLAATPRTPIGQAGGGTIKIAGQLGYAYAPLTAPLSGRACAVYQVRVEERQGNKWVLVIHEIQGQPFFLYDGTGRAMVAYDPQTGIVIKKDVELASQTLSNPTPAMHALLARYNVQPTRIFGLNKAIKYYEGVLEQGEVVTVHGAAFREPEPDPAAAAAAGFPPQWLVMRAAPGVELRITDDAPPEKSQAAA
jgi:hypothetical protein